MTENKKLIKLKEEIEKSQKDLYNSDLDPIIYEKKETPSIKQIGIFGVIIDDIFAV